MCDFSIDYILNHAGDRFLGTNGAMGIIKCVRRQTNQPANIILEFNNNRNDIDIETETETEQSNFVNNSIMFDWLHYTRYHPPKLPRNIRFGAIRRTPGRLPRIPFTPAQLDALENAYQNCNYLSAEEANKLAHSLELTNTRVKIWFQNRRARERREKRMKEENCDSTFSSNASSPEPDQGNIEILH